MTTSICIVEPASGSNVATETRKHLQELADRLVGDEPAALPVLDKAYIQTLKERGRKYAEAAMNSPTWGHGVQDAKRVLLCMMYGLNNASSHNVETPGEAREASYRIEGVFNWANKLLHEAGWGKIDEEQRMRSAMLNAPESTSYDEDQEIQRYTGAPLVSSGTTRLQRPRVLNSSFGRLYIHQYMDSDGPWVCGLLNRQDMLRARFTRKRLGAWLKDTGLYNDDEIRRQVEACKTTIAEAAFTVYPNDVDWEQVYTKGVSSCMADEVCEYETWDGLHPVTAYSSAYHGCGDNGLAIFTVKHDGYHVGRGIYNCKTGAVVRWYGDGERALCRIGIPTTYRALEGSWLAFIEKDKRFIHPYVDGDYSYGRVERAESRVYLESDEEDGSICLSDTAGSSCSVATYFCCDVDEYLPREECTHLPIQNRWISTARFEEVDESELCPVIGEYMVRSDIIYIEGKRVTVSERVADYAGLYLREIPWPEGVEVPTRPAWFRHRPTPYQNYALKAPYTLRSAA